LTVSEITTSSVFLNWTEPEGNRSFYRAEWTDGKASGSVNVTETSINITNLTAGVQYTFNVTAVADDGRTDGQSTAISLYTKPELVKNLTVTEVTTSSVFLSWTEPEGNQSFYRVEWTDGKANWSHIVNETYQNITELTAGVQYTFTVVAMAGDNKTESKKAEILSHTRPGTIGKATVSQNTSSIFLNWTPPNGEVFKYRVEWHNGGSVMNQTTYDAYAVISDLIPGTTYTITLIAIAADNKTEGAPHVFSSVTKPEVVKNLTATEITSSFVFLSWTEPEGNSSFFRVEWTDEKATRNQTVNETYLNITELTSGLQHTFTVIAVAEDKEILGAAKKISLYIRPGTIGEPVVSQNTSSISLNWTPPHGEVFKYRVEWHSGGSVMNQTTYDTFAVLSNLIPGTTYTITVIAIAADNKTEGAPNVFSSVTKPAMVRNLTVTEVTTSSVSLDWFKFVGEATSYTVQWTARGGGAARNVSTNETSITIKELIAGFQYDITVAAVAGNSNEGERAPVTTFTKPEKPGNITVTTRETEHLSISWSLPGGRVDYYLVNISNEELKKIYLCNVTTMATAVSVLNPGRIYHVTVTAMAGRFSNTSDQSSLATIPTPPGSIIINQRTNSSLHLEWATPALMDDAPGISYHITYQHAGDGALNENSTATNTVLSSLSSGTFYNITVETVGPQNFRSTMIHNSTFTLPNPVLNIKASPQSTVSVKVEWSDPLGVQAYYKYRIQTNEAAGIPVNTTTVATKSTIILNLEPGTNYSFTVVTIAAHGSVSTEEQVFSYTEPKAVTNLTAVDLNATAIRLTWERQSDHKPSYSYLVVALQYTEVVQNVSTKTETYTFVDLIPGKSYNFNVSTVVGGVKSTVKSTSSHTSPGAVSNIAAVGTTTDLSVSWTGASGQVDSYTVLLFRDNQLERNSTDLSNTTLNASFQSLKPGTLYCVEVITKSGLLTDSSTVCNATFPSPPGPIMVESQTTDSITFSWALPEDMDLSQYNFSVFSPNEDFVTKNNSFWLQNLRSGTAYNISVVTVGTLHYQSTVVMAQNYTRPYSVTMLRQARISTDAVTLVWKQPESQPHYSYQVTSDSFYPPVVTFNTTYTITGLLSGSNYTFTVTSQTADGTQATPATVSYFTRPHSIRGLEANTLNTTAIRLNWMRPQEYKNVYMYRVETTSCGSQNKTFIEEVAEISDLIPGTNCSFCVFVRAEDSTEGESSCTSQYTKPESVKPSISSEGSNSSMLLSWMAPSGKVEQYVIHLYNTSSIFRPVQLCANSTSFLFENLLAGRVYTAMVITISGTFNTSSGFVANATFPNPPGPIEILTKTTSSLQISWEEAPLMTNAQFHYLVTYAPSQRSKPITTNNTIHNLTFLFSGTPYNISVATVGPMGFMSKEVQIHMVTTRPMNVKFLVASAEEKSVTLNWSQPDDYKNGYRYTVTWVSSHPDLLSITGNKTIGEDEFTINQLHPGSSYNFTVTTETSDMTQSAPEWISSCTNASPVTDLQCEGPNTAEAQLILTWIKPEGRNSGFQVTVANQGTNFSEVTSSCNQMCGYNVSTLNHHTTYSMTVETLSCGKPSTPISVDCMTGITNPLIPENHESLVIVSNIQYNRFSIQIDPSLLDNINGPINNVGVLVTNNIDGVDTLNLKQYLVKTYADWSALSTSVYLATVTQKFLQTRSSTNHLTLDIGDTTHWEAYTNGVLKDNEQYQYAIVLFTQLNVQSDGLVNELTSLVSITGFSPPIKLPQNPAVIGIAVGTTMGIFCVLFIILVGFMIYWKRMSIKESPDIQVHSMRSAAVRVEDYEAYYKKQKANSNCGFAEEFEDLKAVGTAQLKMSALAVENKPKNRYNNVLPYDSSRVKLSIHGSPFDDYINANYMPGYNSRKEYIAAQGPLPCTINEFWRMIWEKNVQTLVMLTRCSEQGRVKCEQYWPSSTKHFANITVTTTSEIPLEDWTIRDFEVKNVKTVETRSVRHFHFTAWPDHGVPQTTELLINFRHLVREHMDQYSRHSPTLVHCSAGVGRTGTFIAIDHLIFQIERENAVDVYGIVHDLRMHRPLMVQTEDQYVFLNQCAMDIIRSRTGTNVDLIYQNTAALSIYENVEPREGFPKNGYHNA
ncbi:hypothetical protein LDENG_00273380, partial [Lucifuga dentata]